MNYQKIYTAFIADRRATEHIAELLGYFEKHHIVPRSLGGTDIPDNLICLTPEDHFFAHLLLAKIHGGKLWYALMAMCHDRYGKRSADSGYLRRQRKSYARARAGYSAAIKEQAALGLHHSQTPEWRAAKSAEVKALSSTGGQWVQTPEGRAQIGEKSKAWWAKNPITPERRAAMSAAQKGKTVSEETRQKQSAAKRGVKPSAETRAKMSAAHKARPWTAEDQARRAASNRAQVWTEERRQKVAKSNSMRTVSAETRVKIAAAHRARGDMADRNKARIWDAAAREKIAAFHRAKRAYSEAHGVPYMTVTKAMIAAGGAACP
jgi:hypothetical protein